VFGYNIENRALIAALEERAAGLSGLTRFDDEAIAITPADADVAIQTRDGKSLSARLVIGADGRQSQCREAAGIEVSRRGLNQAALTFNISHSRPHRNASTEFHTPQGPCVFVPLPGDRCSVVWVSTPKEAERLMALSDDELSERRNGNRIPYSAASRSSRGGMCFRSASSSPGNSPGLASCWSAKPRMCCRRSARRASTWDCATPPISPISCATPMLAGEDPGAPQVLKRYDSARRSDVASRTFAIDLANRSLLSDFLPMQSLRAAGMHLIGSVGPLRRLATREGLAPSWRPTRGHGNTSRPL